MNRIAGAVWVLAFGLAADTEAASKRIRLSITLPGGQQVKVVEVEGQMASVTSRSLSLGLTPTVRGELVDVAIHPLDSAGRPAEKALATVTGGIGDSLTVRFETSGEELRIVPEKVY